MGSLPHRCYRKSPASDLEWIEKSFVHFIFICCWKVCAPQAQMLIHWDNRAACKATSFISHLSHKLYPQALYRASVSNAIMDLEKQGREEVEENARKKWHGMQIFFHIYHVYTDKKKFCPH